MEIFFDCGYAVQRSVYRQYGSGPIRQRFLQNQAKTNRAQKSDWYVVKGTHEAIIDPVLWNSVQTLIAQRARPFSTGSHWPVCQKNALRRLRLHPCAPQKNRGKHYLQCASRRVAKDACTGSFISVDRLEQMVIAELHRLISLYLDIDELERNAAFLPQSAKPKNRLLADQSAYEKRIAEDTRGIRELYMDKVKGILTETDFSDLIRDLSAEKGAAGTGGSG